MLAGVVHDLVTLSHMPAIEPMGFAVTYSCHGCNGVIQFSIQSIR